MSCCGMKSKNLNTFKTTPYISNGWYFIDLCDGYKLKYKTNVYYLVKDGDIWVTTIDEIKQWAIDNCDGMDI